MLPAERLGRRKRNLPNVKPLRKSARRSDRCDVRRPSDDECRKWRRWEPKPSSETTSSPVRSGRKKAKRDKETPKGAALSRPVDKRDLGTTPSKGPEHRPWTATSLG